MLTAMHMVSCSQFMTGNVQCHAADCGKAGPVYNLTGVV